MAVVSGIGQNLGNAWTDKKYEEFRFDYRDEEVCSCLPELKAKKPKKSRVQLLKERIRQFSIWYYENEDQKEIERVKLRRDRQQTDRDIKNLAWMRWLRLLYILDTLIWITGGLLTLCSTVEVLGKNTPFYKRREMYRIIGPLIILVGVVMLFVATAVKHKLMKDLKGRKKNNFFIKEKRGSKRGSTKSRTNESVVLIVAKSATNEEVSAEDGGLTNTSKDDPSTCVI